MNFGFSGQVFRLPRPKEQRLAAKKHKNTKKAAEACDILRSSKRQKRLGLYSFTNASRLDFAACKPFAPVFQPKYGNTFEVEPWCKE